MRTYSGPHTYIDGERVEPAAGGETFCSLYPATGEPLAEIRAARAEDVGRAVASARAGFQRWASLDGSARGRILRRAAELLRERAEVLAEMETLDTGKPITEARAEDVPSAAAALEFFAGVAPTLAGSYHDLPGALAYTRREPLGVCAGIGAWNYPLQIACWKSAPALACGNAMVFKPAELTPVSATALAEIYTEAGMPPGVFNVVQGAEAVGRALVTHSDVAKVSLTGEVATGRQVMAAASGTLKRLTLELGGKSPLIVFADADLEQAVTGALLGNFYTQGEVCTHGTRVYVHAALLDAFAARVQQRVAQMRLGDPLDPRTHMGPLISRGHFDKVMDYIGLGVQQGAEVWTGGRAAVLHGRLAGGWFIEPTVFGRCTDAMRIVHEEIFGPVMAVLSFRDEDEVIARANDTPYGLAAGVYTRDLRRAHRVAAALEAGICWVNAYNVTPIEIPFGPYKHSGMGKENGQVAVESYTQLKTVYVGLEDMQAAY